jgi:hypothetical protein
MVRHEVSEFEYRYGSAGPFLTSALDEGFWSQPRPGRFTPIVHKAGWALRPDWMDVEGTESLAIAGFGHQTVKPVASHYTA